ncbi:MAG: TolC family protein [Bacteriovorax sp.]|nr:TolC family protein [Rhizobacter sp.]
MFTAALPHGPRSAHRLAGIVVACSAFIGLAGHAQQQPLPPPLTLDHALRTAQDRSRQLPSHDFAAAASREMAIAAGQRPDPTLSVGLNNLPVSGPDRLSLTRDFMTMRSVGVMQELTRSDKLTARSARYDREAEAAQAARTLALANLRRDTATAWLERHFQERLLDMLLTQRAEASLQIDASDTAYRSGRGAQADAFAARSAVALIDDRIRLAERQVATARTKLARWISNAADQPLAAAPPLTAVRLNPRDLETQLAHHPALALMLRQEETARADAAVAQSNQRSDWSVGLMFSQRGPAYSNMLSVTASIPLQLEPKHRQDREVAARLAVVEQLRAQREEATREHVAETLGWLQEWQSNRERLSNYDSALIPLAAQRTQAATASYRGGAGLLGAVLEARRLEIDTRVDRLRLEMETAARWAQLEYLVPPEHETLNPSPSTDAMEMRP